MTKELKPKFVVDSCVYIAALDKDEPHHEQSFQFFEVIKRNQYRLFAPVILKLEIENNFRKRARNDATKDILETGNFETILIYMDEKFIRIYEKTMLDLPYGKTLDHLYATVAKHNNSPVITWNKKDFEKYQDMFIMTPAEFITSSYNKGEI